MSRASVLSVASAFSFVLLAGSLQSNVPSSVAGASEWHLVSFKKDVKPLLQRNCAVCHTPGGTGYAKSGFSVQSYQTVMKGTKYGATVVPGSSDSSNLVLLLKHGANPSISMPKIYQRHNESVMMSKQAETLSEHDVQLIAGWIDQGAKNN